VNISKEMLLMGIIFNHLIYVLCVVTITHNTHTHTLYFQVERECYGRMAPP